MSKRERVDPQRKLLRLQNFQRGLENLHHNLNKPDCQLQLPQRRAIKRLFDEFCDLHESPTDFALDENQTPSDIMMIIQSLMPMNQSKMDELNYPPQKAVAGVEAIDPNRAIVILVVDEVGIESFLADHPGLKKTSVTDFKGGRIKGRVSFEKQQEIVAAARETASKLGLSLNSD